MSNRVTDQQTQNALISKFKLEGVLPELEVSPQIIPVVEVAKLTSALTIGEFEKWRSVFSRSQELIDVASVQTDAIAFQTGVTKVASSSNVNTFQGACTAIGRWGCAIPGGSAGAHATDGIYRITVSTILLAPSVFVGSVQLYDQAAFGDPVALGTLRKFLGAWDAFTQQFGPHVVWDKFVKLRTTDQVNAVILDFSLGTPGTGAMAMTVTKLIDEIPPFVIFP